MEIQHKTIIKIDCPNCGGKVIEENAKDGNCTCPYCGHKISFKDFLGQPRVTINRTRTNNTYHSDNIKSDDIKLNIGGQNIHIANPLRKSQSGMTDDEKEKAGWWYDGERMRPPEEAKVPTYYKVFVCVMLLAFILMFLGLRSMPY